MLEPFLHSLKPARKSILVIDVGGGSTELIFRKANEEAIHGKSFNLGAVRLTEMFLKTDPIANGEYQSLVLHVEKTLKEYGPISPEIVIAVAGTPTTLACISQEIDFIEEKVEGFMLSQEKIQFLIESLGAIKIEQRRKVRGMVPERADLIVAGAAILESCLKLTTKDEVRVSTRGLRFGAALHYKEFI